MDSMQFDSLVRSLGRPASRRGALGLLAAAAGLGLGEVRAKTTHHKGRGRGKGKGAQSAAGGGNSACAQFCAQVFGAGTPSAGQCTSEAAKGEGLCKTCGAATAATDICCSRNSSGVCPDYATATCHCTGGQTCQGGTCVTPRIVFECFCQSGGGGGFCQPLTCTPDNVTAFCGSMCANFGGSTARSNCQRNCLPG